MLFVGKPKERSIMTSNINRLYFSSNNCLNCVTSGNIPNLVTSTLTPSHNTQRASPCLSPTSTGIFENKSHCTKSRIHLLCTCKTCWNEKYCQHTFIYKWGVSETHSMSITKCILDASPCQTLKQLGFPEETHYTIWRCQPWFKSNMSCFHSNPIPSL